MAAISGSSLRDDFRFPGNPREKYLCDGSLEDDIVITGMSGRFPQSDNVTELIENLFQKKKMYEVTDVRWAKTHMTSKNRTGLLRDVSKFDANFFKMRSSVVNLLDPMQRILLEVCHETILDAGYDPATLSGKRIGVFIGVNDPDILVAASKLKMDGPEKSMFSNNFCSAQISFYFNFRGCCLTMDTACSSSLAALHQAVTAIKSGVIDAAIVGGSKLNFDPDSGDVTKAYGITGSSGHCRPFDSRNDGMVRSEAIATLFIQKAKDARRIYAKILGIVSMSSGYHKEGIFHPCKGAQVDMMETCLKNTNVKPSDVKYVEAHGTGTKVGDATEIESFEEVFCKDRKEPLLVGSIKSNLGHSECVAGVTGVIKAIIASETGLIPPNADFIEPSPQCEALINGKIKVVAEATPFEGSFTAVNSYGIGGVVANVILEKGKREHEQTEEQELSCPQIILYGATTEEALKNLFENIQSTTMPREFFSLLHKSAYISPESNIYRGYAVLDQENVPKSFIERVSLKKRKVWYVVTGMGCQWSGMGLDLMQFDVFAKSMKRSAKILEPFGIDLFELLNPKVDYLHRERNITPAFVTIVAIQIALVDILKELGIEPDGIVGHSTGEIVCSYIDGCSTAEQAILSSYYRGYATENSNLSRGVMAAVGLSWEEAKARCPDGVFAACNNSQDSVTISGYKEKAEKFIEQLKAEDVFVRKVDAYGYAFHSEGLKPAAGLLETKLRKVYSNPKQRTPRWISTSYEEKDWETTECKTVNAKYFTHNLLSPVHFYEALKKIPSDAITIEIGPHNLLKSILKRGIGPEASLIGLMRRKENNIHFLLSSIGQLYNLGLDPQVENLYPPVSYPVPRGTPMISSLIKWDHSQTWFTPKPPSLLGDSNPMTIHVDGKDRYLLDHCIDGRPLYPAAGYIFLAWTSLCKFFGKEMTETPIVIENMKILRATILKEKGTNKFQVDMRFSNGDFEISEGGSVVATGRIYFPSGPLTFDTVDLKKYGDISTMIEGQEIYNELKIMGYKYGPFFQSIQEMEINGNFAYVAWRNKWIPFLDAMLLLFGFGNVDDELRLPTAIQSLKIDPKKFKEFLSKAQENDKGVPVSFNARTRVCTAPGLQIHDLRMEVAQRRQDSDSEAYLEEYCFVPYTECDAMDLQNKQKCQEYIDASLQEAFSLPLPTELKFKIKDLKLNSAVRNKLENNFDPNDPKHVILSAMKEIRDALEKKCDISRISSICENNLKHFGEDILYRTLLEGTAMKSLVDVVLENSGRRLTVVELCDKGPTLSIVVHDMLNALSQVKLNCSLIQGNTPLQNAQDLNSRNVKIEELSKIFNDEWEIKFSAHIVLGSFVMGCKDSLTVYIRRLVQLTKESGFIIFAYKYEQTLPEMFLSALGDCPSNIQTQSAAELKFEEENVMLIAKKSGPFGSCIYLLRKSTLMEKSSSGITVVPILDGNYRDWVEQLKSAMNQTQKTDEESAIWLVAEDSPTNGIIGLVNCLKQEPGGEKIRCVFINDKSLTSLPKFDIDNSHFSEVLRKNLLVNVYKNGCWGSFRHNNIQRGQRMQLAEHAALNYSKFGDLSSFAWFSSPNSVLLPSMKSSNQKILCHVYYTALNFKDVMLATGRIQRGVFGKNASYIGMEFSGRDASGRRIFGLSETTSLGTTIFCHPDCINEVPDNWSLEEASTVYIVYATAYCALLDRGRLAKGEKILIHSGAGGVGQAAIRIASSLNCEIFTTVGTEEKKTFLMKTFPHLKPENIGCSHDTSFEELVMDGTDGNGVDVVLNSLSEEKFQASVRCLGINGRFLEIGKYDMAMDHNLGLRPFLKNLTFSSVMLDRILSVDKDKYGYIRKMSKYLKEGLKQGVIKPLNTTVFGSDEVGEAFRYMASGKHIGKVVVKIREEEPEKIFCPLPLKVLALKELHLYRDKMYIVIGGLGGFGIELTKWLISKGARNIILTSRYGARTPYHHLCLKRWKDYGANVLISTLNVIKKDSAKELLREASAYGPVGGIFNSALVLKDAFLENQTVEGFEDVCAPKALATKHLDDLTRRMCPSLDFFVCFSSVSCGKGNAGQTNYGYANSVMERICELRQKDGLHGLAIQWGIIDDVGIVHRQFGEDAVIAGVMPQKVEHCLRTLEGFLLQSRSVVSSFVKAEVLKDDDKSDDMMSRLLKVLNLKDLADIGESTKLQELGIDSILGTELQQLLLDEMDIRFSISEIQNMTFQDLRDMNDQKSREKTSSKRTYLNEIKTSPRANVSNSDALFSLNEQRKGMPMIVVHGNDLLLHSLKDLGNRTKRPMYGIQCTEDTPMGSLKDLVCWYQEEIFKISSGSAVTLIGCSTGGLLALEIALQDAQFGKFLNIGSVVILDGAMEVVDILNDTEKKSENETNEISDITKFISGFSDCDLSQLTSELKLFPSLESKLNRIIDLVTSSDPENFNRPKFATAVKKYALKQRLMRTSCIDKTFSKDLTVIEAAEKCLPNDVSLVKSSMSKVCEGRITVHRLGARGEFLMDDTSISAIAQLLENA